jgi:hypothetical protein
MNCYKSFFYILHHHKWDNYFFIIPRIQVRSATANCMLVYYFFTPKNTSCGDLNPSTFLGRWLIRSVAHFTCSCVDLVKSIPLGKYCRSNPLVFSLSLRFHDGRDVRNKWMPSVLMRWLHAQQILCRCRMSQYDTCICGVLTGY